MTVVFDLLGVQNRDHGERGIARYVTNLALALEADFPDIVDHYLVHPELPIPGSINPILASGKVISSDHLDHDALSPTAGGVFISGSVFELEQSLQTVLPAWARTPHWRRAGVLYDLIPMRFESRYLANEELKLRYLTRAEALRSFDHLLAISQASAQDAVDLLQLAESAISTIGAGADTQFQPPQSSPSSVAGRLTSSGRFPGLKPGYILFPTGFDFRKNIEKFLRAYAALEPGLRSAHQLVMACSLNGPQEAHIGELMAQYGLSRGELILTGWLSDNDLVAFNQGAHLVVFPSLYEGFGLPVLEARHCGAAVLCGDNSSLAEVQPDESARFDATSVPAMTASLNRALTAPGEIERLRGLPIPQFSWADSAAGTTRAIQLLKESLNPGALPRLGLISPLPPQQTGIATYTGRLVEHLQHYADITVFVEVDSDTEDLPPAPAGVTVAPLSHLQATVDGGGAFDRLLYFMGNSRFHVDAMAALQRNPGAVLFHDVRLSGLYNEAHRMGRNGVASVGETLAEMYPGRYRASLEKSASISPDDANRFGVLMTREAAMAATEILVHSPYAATLIELDTGIEAEVCYPLPAPHIEDIEAGAGPLVVSSFGVIDPVKSPEAVIEAIADVRTAFPDVRLRLIGPIDPAYRRDLDALVKRLDLTSVVDIPGHLDDVEFRAAQRSTTIAVQLRTQSNGESSAAVAELLAAGIPTIVSNLGSMAHLPDSIVRKVEAGTAQQLARVLLELARDTDDRAELSANAQEWARANSFASAAAKLAETLFG